MVADELRRQADHFIELQDLRDSITRPAEERGEEAVIPVETEMEPV